MITIKNSQKSIPFAVNTYRNKAEVILQYIGYNDFDLGIWLTTNRTIQKYNQQFRGKDKPTDVLSFPYHPNLKAGKKIKILCEEDKNVGDIIISVPYVFANKHNIDLDFNGRMDRMLVHGICHLLGYDHIKDSDFKKMIALENKLMKLIEEIQ